MWSLSSPFSLTTPQDTAPIVKFLKQLKEPLITDTPLKTLYSLIV